MFEIDIMQMTCCNCGVIFWITKDHRELLLKSKEYFYCPNGHSQSFVGKTDKQKLEEQKKIAEENYNSYESELIVVEHLNKVINGYKGQLAKQKKQKKND